MCARRQKTIRHRPSRPVSAVVFALFCDGLLFMWQTDVMCDHIECLSDL